MTIGKISALVLCLCKLHNFCLDQRDLNTSSIPAVSDDDRLTLYDMSSDAESPPGYFLNGSNHFDDVPGGRRTARRFENGFNTTVTPRDDMLRYISNGNWKRQVRTHNKR